MLYQNLQALISSNWCRSVITLMAMLIKYKESEMGLQLKIQNNMSLIKIYFHL